ncbi:MAG: AAA family ATPase [Gemmatimonas sp.]|nr:AAA family ATPase [Gemmatimonas sp.]
MRPKRLELEGFASFRERTTIEFEDTELFVLTGPTGSGKSSVIDAITFALYGSVPRYEDRRLVAPVISQGMAEARVRLDFVVGTEAYTAVRVVRRTGKGATTKEARLEDGGGHSLAGNAEELTRAVEGVIGLTFDHFVRCVVLPQGDFAEFMRARPKDRQDLLVGLLGLRDYERIGSLARQRSAGAQAREGQLERRLSDLVDASGAALKEAEARVGNLEALLTEVEAAQPLVEDIQRSLGELAADVEATELRGRSLESIGMPPGAEKLAARVAAARDASTKSAKAVAAAQEAADTAEDALRDLPAEVELSAIMDAYRRLTEQRETLSLLKEKTGAASEDAEKVAADALVASELAGAATEQLESLRREHSAFHLAGSLAVGGTCPVCLHSVDRLPEHERPEGLAETEAELRKRQEEAQRTAKLRERVVAELNTATALEAAAQEQVVKLESGLQEAPPLEEVGEELESLRQLEERVDTLRATLRAARKADEQAKGAEAALSDEVGKAWKVFNRARDTVAEMSPPAPPLDDLAEAWSSLTNWAFVTSGEVRDSLETLRATAEAQARERLAISEQIRAACKAAGVVVGSDERPRDAVVSSLAEARANCTRLVDRIAEAEKLRAERSEARETAQVAGLLGQHLRATGFEAWLLNRALERLVDGATQTMRELSSGAYSLALTGTNEFEVIDHRNADERRSAKTLSGGETFLASLSLALALADQVADLVSGSAARLDSLFLDEGFGTLDTDTLDIVAAAIEELGARGRMVGLVTHVRELAERIPVRYEVRKAGGTSTVERSAA